MDWLHDLELSLGDGRYWNVPLVSWLRFGLAWAIAATIVLAVGWIVRTRLRWIAARTHTRWDDILSKTTSPVRGWLLALAAAYPAAVLAGIDGGPKTVIARVAIVATAMTAVFVTNRGIRVAVEDYRERNVATEPASVTSVQALGFLGRLAVWSTGVLLVLSNFGVDVTTLIAGLGIGGVAVALAVQSTLGDMFATLSILLDKPFQVGDTLDVGGFVGRVERIGLKTTRLRSVTGEEIVAPNGDLLKSKLRNFQDLTERRVLLNFGVEYGTPREKIECIPGILRGTIAGQPDVRFDRAHFKGFGPQALEFEAVYFVTSADYGVYMDRQQAVNLAILATFEVEEIAFATPVHAVRVVPAAPRAETR